MKGTEIKLLSELEVFPDNLRFTQESPWRR